MRSTTASRLARGAVGGLLFSVASAAALAAPPASAAAATSVRSASEHAGRPGTEGPGAGARGRLLERPRAGRAAVRALGTDLPEAARRNGLSAERLTDLLLQDDGAVLDPQGSLLYVEEAIEGPAPAEDRAEPGEVAAGAVRTTAAPATTAQALSLHSRPGAALTIVLDVDGHEVASSSWSTLGLADGFHPEMDLDDRPGFSASELSAIYTIWARVAEDYAPFDVDVTTEEPPAGALERTSTTDASYGVRVLITPGLPEAAVVCGGGCSGIAYVNVFDRVVGTGRRPSPAWVFHELAANSPRWIGETASHEAGHTLGLSHHGDPVTSYYDGRGLWAPIMGGGGRSITQWSDGSYPGASNSTQDDLAVIGRKVPVVADDHADDFAAATPLPGATSRVEGLITTRADRDLFAVAHGACPITVRVDASTIAPNLDARVRVLDETGSVVAQADPASTSGSSGTAGGMGAALTTPSLASGTHYVEVDGVGWGDPAGTGYSDYSSLGPYLLDVTGCAAPAADTGDESEQAPAPTTVAATSDGTLTRVTWSAPAGSIAVTGYQVDLAGPGSVAPAVTGAAARSTDVAVAVAGTYEVTVRALTDSGPGQPARTTVVVPLPRPAAVPGPPQKIRVSPGARGGRKTAQVRWAPPLNDGGSPVTGYRVTALRVVPGGRVVGRVVRVVAARDTSAYRKVLRLQRARYQFVVRALNDVGLGPSSSRSRVVRAR